MGLNIPSDLEGWHSWQRRRHAVSYIKGLLSPHDAVGETHATIVRGSPDADIVVVVDAIHASMSHAVVAPLRALPPERVIAVLGPGVSLTVPGRSTRIPLGDLPGGLRGGSALLGCGHYTTTGGPAWAWARAARVPTFVAQHGALTPYAPPLPSGATLLSWSEADGTFWASGRTDVAHAPMGSQLLWAASRRPMGASLPVGAPLVYLGQGHAAEIARLRMIEAAGRFCRTHHAIYRPHPSERDKMSRIALAGLARAGVRIDRSGQALSVGASRVVSVFSTGVLETAARGGSAWVDFPRPPGWLEEFWDRYSMRRVGDSPTPPPQQPTVSPAERIAALVTGSVR